MLERGGGAIVNVGVGVARQPAAMNVDYGAAKAALTDLTKAPPRSAAPQGVRVNTVSPGPVRTPWWTDDGGAADVFAAASARPRRRAERVAPEMMELKTGRLVDPAGDRRRDALLASPRSASTTGPSSSSTAGC